MVGIIIGTVCLVGLVKVTRGHGACGHHHGLRRRGRRGHHTGGPLERLLGPLELRATQRDQIEVEVKAFFEKARSMREEGDATRKDIARAMRAESVDEVTLGEMFARHDDRLRELRLELVERLARIHRVLDDRQRELLADRLEAGLGFGGPFRRGW